METPFLSIITACYNSEKTISRTIQSLLDQSYSNFEYIIIDGNSVDETVKIIESFEKGFSKKGIQYKWISEKDSGIYDAWNKGLKLADGDWISFLGSDDFYLKDALENYIELIKKNHKYYDWVYSNVKFVDSENTSRILNSTWSWKKFKRNISITPAHVGSFHNKEYFIKYGTFDTSFKIAGDYEMLLRAGNNLKTNKLDKITAVMSAGGVSNNMIKRVFKETLNAKFKTGKLNLFICYLDYYYSFGIYLLKKVPKN